jgi:adenosine deaminase
MTGTHDDAANDWTAEETGPIDRRLRLNLLARRLPRAELHMHLIGALRPSQVGRASDGRGADGALDYVDVMRFFERHRELASSFDELKVLATATERVLENAVDSGCRHVELSVNSLEFDGSGLSFDDVLDAVTLAFDRVGRRTGLTGGVIIAMDRDSHPDAGMATLDQAAAAQARGVPVLGIGNDGSPSRPLTDFAEVFAEARGRGFRVTAHANKAHDIGDAIELGLDRIDHAWELQGQPDLQRSVAEARTPVTMAMSSCLLMLPGRFPTAESFPFDELRRAGVNVTLNVDDAGMFFTDSAQEYRLAADTYGYDGDTLAQIALASLEAAWIDDDRDNRIAAWTREAHALVLDPRNPQIGAPRS